MNKDSTQYILVNELVVQRCLDDIRARSCMGKTVWSCVIKPYKKKRSEAQNRLYWMWLHIIADELGYQEPDDIHDELATHYLEPIVYTGFDDEVHVRRQSTTKLSIHEFTKYLNLVERWAVIEFNIRLPHPVDYDEAMGR